MRQTALFICVLSFLSSQASTHKTEPKLAYELDAYLQPFVETNNFSGVALITQNGHRLLEKAYGFEDRERHITNKTTTRFHVASVSMQFTAAAIMRLVDTGKISVDSHVAEYLPGIPGAEKITIRDLLTQRSGLPDINNRSDYGEILQHHQTPASLVDKIERQPLLFDPGSKFLREEHSAYNLLALIIEKKTGLPFAQAMQQLVFVPAGLRSTGIDDDAATSSSMALGYQPEGMTGLTKANAIHWSAKAGNASVYTTAADEARWVSTLFEGRYLSASSRQILLDTSPRVGYGWFRAANSRFNEIAYYMNGRSPGFASFVLYLPKEHVTVVVLSNIYSSATTTIGNDLAAIALGLPSSAFHPDWTLNSRELSDWSGGFQFGPDFYQPNAVLRIVSNGEELRLQWPSNQQSPLIPLSKDHFLDRSYWEQVSIERDSMGKVVALKYGDFRGAAVRDVQK